MADETNIPAAIEPIESAGGTPAGSEAVRRRMAAVRPPKPAAEGEHRPDPSLSAGADSGASAGASTAPSGDAKGPGRPAGSKTKKRSGRKLTKTELRERAREDRSQREAAEKREQELRAQLDHERNRQSAQVNANDPETRERRVRNFAATAETLYRFMARHRGPHWLLSKDDARMLGECTVDGIEAIRDILAPIIPMASPVIDKVYDLTAPATMVGVHWAVWDERAEKDERANKGEPTGQRVALVQAPA